MKIAACLLAAMLAAGLEPALAGSSTRLQVHAHVLPMVKVRHAESVRMVEVRAGEAVLDIPGAARLEVFTNTGAFALDFHLHDAAVEEVTVDGLDAPVSVRASGGTAVVRFPVGSRVHLRTLHYRVRYAPGTPAGARPSPLAVSVRADV
jgi:hypothetical protein